jgi:hypothetical protein
VLKFKNKFGTLRVNPDNKHGTIQTAGWAGSAVGLEVLKGHEILTSSNAPTTGSGAYTAIYSVGTVGSFPGNKAAGAWAWLLVDSHSKEYVVVYLHLPHISSRHGAKPSTGTT